jgi:hypothetical protein
MSMHPFLLSAFYSRFRAKQEIGRRKKEDAD